MLSVHRYRGGVHRAYVLVEPAYQRCVVPGCLGWFRTLDKNGMCPRELWSLDHFDYAKRKRVGA